MQLYPKDIKDKLEFNKIIDYISAECLSDMGRDYFAQIEILTDLVRIERLIDETDEYKKAIERGEHLPLYAFESISSDVELLRKEGYVLDIDSIRNIYRIVSMGLEISKYFADAEKVKFNPLIHEIVSNIIIDKALITEIDRVLDEEGDVRPNASEELMRISKSIRSKERELEKVFNEQLESFKSRGFLVDTLESLRNGRRVLTVAVEHKRKIPGIIHDESATGKTVYIEPEKVISINHEVYNLYAERRHEIYKILRALCAFIRPYADALLVVQHTLVKLDTIRAKAKFAYRFNAKKPYLNAKSAFGLKTAFNPVLVVKNEATSSPVIPFDLELFGNNRILVLSGPNAGGKSVALKSVGLLQLMLQSGMLVTADENSKMGIFTKIFVDIGDQQSLEDDLSTYSSHLRNMRITTEEADPNTLILIDEFGSGTDPKIGGAIAEAILNDLNHKKVFGVITTHYSNLKYFAFKAHGLVNGSMEFDKNHLIPTFRMHIGKPGSSFAFEIAEKTGLDARIVSYAQHKTGKNEKAIDEMLITLMSEKKEYEEKLASLLDKQDRLDKLIGSYEHLNADLEIKRKKIKLQAKEQAAIKVMDQHAEMQKIIKEIKHSKDEEKALEASIALKKKREDALKELEALKMEVFAKEAGAAGQQKLVVGSHVRMRNGTSTGEILSIDKNMAEIQMGFIKLKVALIDLTMVKEPIEIRSKKSIQTNISKSDSIDTKIDIREYTKSDALNMLQNFMDRALLNNAYELKIIHGVGTGVMKNEVKKMLKQYKDVREIWHPEPDQGGEGVTLVRF
ncbi:MAG: Smr/MutS family protein [Saprospiraceae bacterium]|nr:Smr/MutS family protein [Saprospiraceae bacterium]MBK8826148.1 Smr/MutS family protein [Saprospiraceae bacterium]HQV66761.1 Smr/MutS family protein [Saprospiraceae bacterium]HQV97499.1 Smr/MutS family protein [Saprospiraceae bacterium]